MNVFMEFVRTITFRYFYEFVDGNQLFKLKNVKLCLPFGIVDVMVLLMVAQIEKQNISN